MKHLLLTAGLLLSLSFAVQAQRSNPWLDSTQINRSCEENAAGVGTDRRVHA